MTSQGTVYTIGHSNRTLAEFLGLLSEFGVRQLVDVRGLPGSRAYPHFNKEALEVSLPGEGVQYLHMAGLGGRRRRVRDSETNAGWTEAAFRGYADYALTPEFQSALNELVEVARQTPSAIMCAEAVPWRCHRRIIADYLMLTRGFSVLDIISRTKAEPHQPISFATLQGDVVVYPAELEVAQA